MRYTLVDRNRLMRFLMALAGALFLGVVVYSQSIRLKADATTPSFTVAQRDWWSLKPVVKPAVPDVRNRQWVKTPIDAFVLASLEAKGLAPNPAADRVTLLRRASIDITGLPPTDEEIAQFVNDKSPTAWAKVVDRLLASPQYGERWGRHWLDLARYADSNGFKADETRPHIWRYRDYVIEAFNKDKPYDRFVREQIAGDELYPGDPEALVAMGFNRHWIDETNAAGLMTRRQETLDDMTNVTGATFLGLTVACARCHDHKTDPILHTDYYRLQAFFANTSFGDGPLPPADPAERKAYAEQKATWEEKTKAIRAEMETILEPLRRSRMMGGIKTFEDEVQAAILKDPGKRDVSERMMFHTASPRITFDEEPDARTLRSLKGDAATRFNELKKQLAEFDSIRPKKLLEGQFMTDIGREAPPVYTLKNGNWQAKGTLVQPGFLQILDPNDPTITPPAGLDSTGRRSVLAGWLTDPRNPLPARVMVNRIWHYHFGRGIVSTPGDFGRMGARPTHPELLDYLASTFVEGGWRMKAMHRMILLSNSYQQSSATQEAAAKVDPDNKLLWRYNRHRMEAEAVRDSMLFVSGRLNPQMGGPGVFPKVPRGVLTELSATAATGGWSTEKDPAQMNRRSVYIFVRRNLRYPMLQAFDNANSFESAHARTSSVTASQALDLLNDELINEWGAAFAERVKGQDATAGTPAQVTRAYKLAYGRDATAEEQKAAAAFFESQSKTAGTRAKALVDFSHALLASNEFLYVN